MGLLQKDLALSILPLSNNPRGNRYQALLKGADKQFISAQTLGNIGLSRGLPVLVEFRIESNEFKFETQVAQDTGDGLIVLVRPRMVRKTRIREAPRVPLSMAIHFSNWNRSDERAQATMLDISELGVRMVSATGVKKNSLISLDFFIKEAGIRVMTQAQAVWCRGSTIGQDLYEIGVQFTTLSTEIRYNLGRYVYSKIAG